MVADRATHTFSPQRRSRCRWGSIVVPEPRLLLFPALALSLPARIIPQPTHRHRGRTAFAASPAAGAHRALRDRCVGVGTFIHMAKREGNEDPSNPW